MTFFLTSLSTVRPSLRFKYGIAIKGILTIMMRLSVEEQQVLQDFSERLALSEKAIESYRTSIDSDARTFDQPNHLKILPTYMLSETLSATTLEKSFENIPPSNSEAAGNRPSRLLVPTIKQLSSTVVNESYAPYKEIAVSVMKRPKRPASAPKRRRTNSKGSINSVKNTPNRKSSAKRTSSTVTKPALRTPSRTKATGPALESLSSLRFEVRKLLPILRDHMKKCPALMQDIKRGGGSKLLGI